MEAYKARFRVKGKNEYLTEAILRLTGHSIARQECYPTCLDPRGKPSIRSSLSLDTGCPYDWSALYQSEGESGLSGSGRDYDRRRIRWFCLEEHSRVRKGPHPPPVSRYLVHVFLDL